MKNSCATPSLPPKRKYDSNIPIKNAKAADIKKIVEKYVPPQFQSYYDNLWEGDASPETDESDE